MGKEKSLRSREAGPIAYILTIIRTDFWVILFVLLCLLASLGALLKIQTAMQSCNDHWQREVTARCTCTWDIQQTGAPYFNPSILDQYNTS